MILAIEKYTKSIRNDWLSHTSDPEWHLSKKTQVFRHMFIIVILLLFGHVVLGGISIRTYVSNLNVAQGYISGQSKTF